MNNLLRRMVMERDGRRRDYNRRGGDYGRRDYGRGEYSGEFRGEYDSDYGDDYARRGRRRDYGYEDEYERDGRRGVKGTGPYGIGGRLHYPRRDYGRDDYDEYEDGRRGYRRDYGDDEMKLDREDIEKWARELENADGTRGAHFTLSQIKQAAEALGIRPASGDFDEKELYITANMFYSDFCDVFKQFIPRDKEAMVYTKAAKAFLEDKDSRLKGSEKLAQYYIDFVCKEME